MAYRMSYAPLLSDEFVPISLGGLQIQIAMRTSPRSGLRGAQTFGQGAVERRIVTSRLGVKSQTAVLREVCAALGVGPGDQIGYTIQQGRVILTAIKNPLGQDDPLACFDERASEADTEGYASI